MELATSPNTFVGISFFRVLLSLLRILFEYFIRKIHEYPRTDEFTKTRALLNSKNHLECLVLGNGPSSEKINITEVKRMIDKKELEVFTVNLWPLSEFAANLDHNYWLVLSDSYMVPSSNMKNVAQLWMVIRENASIRLVTPLHWKSEIENLNLNNEVFYFNDLGLEGRTRGISPLRARGYTSITGMKALAFAIHCGYKKINILGFDNSAFKSLSVTDANRLTQRSAHISNTALFSGKDITDEYSQGVADYFYVVSKIFSDYRRFFANKQIINLDPASLIDAFPKITNHPLVVSIWKTDSGRT